LDNVILALIVAGVTGAVSSFGTVLMLKVHILYLRENLERLDKTVLHAHSRIDSIDPQVKQFYNSH